MRLAFACSVVLSLAGCSTSTTIGPDGGGPVVRVEGCAVAALRAALEAAGPGETVEIGACEIDASGLVVPPGVTLSGSGETTFTAGPVTLAGDDTTCTTIRGLRMTSDGPAAIQTSGPGQFCIVDVQIEATRGVGIASVGATRVTVTRTQVVGPVTPTNVMSEPVEPDVDLTATDGLSFDCAQQIVLEDVEAWGWSFVGVRAVNSRLDWRGGRAGGGGGAGVLLHHSEAELTDVLVAEVLIGARILPAYGLIVDESRLRTSGLTARDNEGYGVLQSGGDAEHVGATLSGNFESGLWVQQGALVLSESRTEGNGLAGVTTAEASSIRIEDSVLATSRANVRVLGETGVTEIGSGLFVTRHGGPLTLRRVRLEDNELTGAIIALTTPFDSPFVIEDVTVSPGAQGFGVLGGPPPDEWQSGVTPTSATDYAPDPALDDPDATPMPLPAVPPRCP